MARKPPIFLSFKYITLLTITPKRINHLHFNCQNDLILPHQEVPHKQFSAHLLLPNP